MLRQWCRCTTTDKDPTNQPSQTTTVHHWRDEREEGRCEVLLFFVVQYCQLDDRTFHHVVPADDGIEGYGSKSTDMSYSDQHDVNDAPRQVVVSPVGKAKYRKDLFPTNQRHDRRAIT